MQVAITQLRQKTHEEVYTRVVPLDTWYGRRTDDQLRRLVGDVQFNKKPVVAMASDGLVYRVEVVR